MPIILALIVNQLQSERFKKFTQTVLYSPSFISVVVVVGMIFLLFSPRSGIVNNAIVAFGGEPDLLHGFAGVVPAALHRVGHLADRRVLDDRLPRGADRDRPGAARGGASRRRQQVQRIRHIDIPGIMPVITILFILAIGNLFNLGFEKVLLMQTDLNLPTSEVIQTYVYQVGLQQAQFSYSAAIGLFNSLINLVLLLTFNWVAQAGRPIDPVVMKP